MIGSKRIWFLLVCAFIASLFFVHENFTKANSIVNVNITMDRSSAIGRAAALKERYAWGPSAARSAAVFELDERIETFVELEAGGKDVFRSMLRGKLLSPYTWRVRFFREGEVNETQVEFTPAGVPYGFVETLSENAPGPTLGETDARRIAEESASKDWGIKIENFHAVETSKEVRPGGRVDHIFVYEREKERVGEGKYRLTLVVSGDRFTQLTQFLKIPESFDRRYENMRSANNTIAEVDSVIFYVLYLGIGCFGGLFFLLRRHYLLWRNALVVAIVMSVLGVLAELNNLPVTWMTYNTSITARVFVLNFFTRTICDAIESALILALSFIVAESLTRRAFPHIVQFWKVWSPGVASSADILGQTVLGYLIVGFLLAYDVALYLVGNKWLGWWAPSDTLVDPNILGMYLPWLTPLANAFHAGFWEECLFRAVPLSAAALLGTRIGRPRLTLGIALVAQALIFGAAHANYPNQPAYARIVEIAPVFFIFGLIYLRFGLLPCIVAHFGVDMCYMSLPIFFTQTSGIWTHRVIAVGFFALPLIIVVMTLIRRRGWHPVSSADLNGAWQPVVASPPKSPPPPSPLQISAFKRKHIAIALVLGLLALVAWACLGDFHSHAEKLALTRAQARTAAHRALADCGLMPTGKWETTTIVLSSQGEAERYVWQEYGSGMYDRLQSMRHLDVPVWNVRLARFDKTVDVAERAETFGAILGNTGEVIEVYHRLPEARCGAEMTQEEARDKALTFLAKRLKLDTAALKEIATVPQKRPNRTDWNVTLAYTNMPPFTNNEVAISVGLSDGAVTGYNRYFHTPEKWSRDQAARIAVYRIVTVVCSILVIIGFMAGMVVGIVRWSSHKFAAGAFFRVCAAVAVLAIVKLVIGWPEDVAGFSTAQPWVTQCLLAVVKTAFAAFMLGPIVGLLLGQAGYRTTEATRIEWSDTLVAASTGLCVAVVLCLAYLWMPEWEPHWPEFVGMNSYAPPVFSSSALALLVILRTSFMVFVLSMVNGWTGGKGFVSRLSLLTVLGVVLAGRHEVQSLQSWIESGILLGTVMATTNEWWLRDRMHLLPVTYSAVLSVELAREVVINGYVGAVTTNVAAMAAVFLTGWVLANWLNGRRNHAKD